MGGEQVFKEPGCEAHLVGVESHRLRRCLRRAIQGASGSTGAGLNLARERVADALRVGGGYPLAYLRLAPVLAAIQARELGGATGSSYQLADVSGAAGLGVHAGNAPGCVFAGQFPKRC